MNTGMDSFDTFFRRNDDFVREREPYTMEIGNDIGYTSNAQAFPKQIFDDRLEERDKVEFETSETLPHPAIGEEVMTEPSSPKSWGAFTDALLMEWTTVDPADVHQASPIH